MLHITQLDIPEYEKVIEAKDPATGLDCFIAIHDTTIGPSLGGARMYPYTTRNEALEDVLRLSKGMTYKSVLAKTGFGGGKAVIIGNPQQDKTPELLRSFGQVVEFLHGDYITAEDIGMKPQDLLIIGESTQHIVGLDTDSSSGDPGRFTAWGVYKGILAVAKRLYNYDNVCDLTIAIQGIGSVGLRLADILFWQGARLILSDVDEEKAKHYSIVYGAQYMPPQEILAAECDILAPCAIGGIINCKTIPNLKCKAIAGAANNQLKTAEDGIILNNKGIIYAPDYIINAGGIINVAAEFDPKGYNPTVSRDRVNHIYNALTDIFEIAQKGKIPTSQAADILAEKRLKEARER